MRELNTKEGIFLITYSQKKVDEEINDLMDNNDSDGCKLFISNLRSFNPSSPYYITEEDSIELTEVEVKSNLNILYKNYKGNPLGFYISDAKLLFKNPILSLKSAFQASVPIFDFESDVFLIKKI